MPRHRLNLEQQKSGIEAALRSKATPRQFRAGLRHRLDSIKRELNSKGTRSRVRRPKFLGWFQF